MESTCFCLYVSGSRLVLGTGSFLLVYTSEKHHGETKRCCLSTHGCWGTLTMLQMYISYCAVYTCVICKTVNNFRFLFDALLLHDDISMSNVCVSKIYFLSLAEMAVATEFSFML